MSDHIVMRVKQRRRGSSHGTHGHRDTHRPTPSGPRTKFSHEEWERQGPADFTQEGEDLSHTNDNPFKLAPWAEQRRDDLLEDFESGDQNIIDKQESDLEAGKGVDL